MSSVSLDNNGVLSILVKNGILSKDKAYGVQATFEQEKSNARTKGALSNEPRRIVDILLDESLVSSKQIAEAISESQQLPVYTNVELSDSDYDKAILRSFKPEVVKEIQAIVLKKNSDNKYLAVAVDPSNLKMKIRLKSVLKTETSMFNFQVISKDDFDNMFNHLYNLTLSIDSLVKENEDGRRASSDSILALNEKNDISTILDTVLERAIVDGASDIHIESTEQNVIVRYRIDTVPIIGYTFSSAVESMLMRRVILESNLEIDKVSVPQDGRFEKVIRGNRYDFRVNVMPAYLPRKGLTSKVSIRILNGGKLAADIRKIGFLEKTFEDYSRMIHEPHGLVLVVGPMGSGKTTTLYSTIAHLSPKNKVIMTLEDPPEFSIEYVTQSKIEPKAGFTYASGMKALLRQDADIILLGEIRETEVAKLAIQSAEIGRLVFSTLHVDNAVSSVLRLYNLGIEPFFVSSVLVGVISQRLVRRVCPKCAKPYSPKESDIKSASALLGRDLSGVTFLKGAGCDDCNHTGYSGLIPTYEVLNFKEITELRQLVASGEMNNGILTDVAVKNGYKPMIFDAFAKVVEGFTTFEEVERIVMDVSGRKMIKEAIENSEK